MHIVHLMASPFVGGPERQVLGLARALAASARTSFLSFAERGLARPFLQQARQDGFEAIELAGNFPRIGRAIREIVGHVRDLGADVLCCNGYKPDLIGWCAARRIGIPVVAIAHGWTGVTLKVRLYERLDAFVMRFLDATVCVSEAMAVKVRRAGVGERKVVVIPNAIDAGPYDKPAPEARKNLESLFASPPGVLVGAVGRLSPEKGFDVLVEAASVVCRQRSDVGFVIFGDGPLRAALQEQIQAKQLGDKVILGGFRTDLDRLLPGFHLAVSSSHTEGLPVAVLEAQAAGLSVVATAVGGTPEVILDGTTGWLVPAGNPAALAEKLLLALADRDTCVRFGQAGWHRVRAEFTFAARAVRYRELFTRLIAEKNR